MVKAGTFDAAKALMGAPEAERVIDRPVRRRSKVARALMSIFPE